MSFISINYTSYLFFASSNDKICENAKRVSSSFKTITTRIENNSQFLVCYNTLLKGDIIFQKGINRVSDLPNDYFEFKNIRNINDIDTLLSYAKFDGNEFIAATDYLGLINHYYYHSNETFICSDNIFNIVKILNLNLSEEGIYETLFFRFPYSTNTFYKDIKQLEPFQQISFSNFHLKFSNTITLTGLLFDELNIDKSIDNFFSLFKSSDRKSDTPILSFSGGSDSMTILAILNSKNIDFRLASFEGHNSWDTNRIINLAKKYKQTLSLYNTKWEDKAKDYNNYTYLTNGLTLSYHFQSFYSQLPKNSIILDGYSFILGDWSDAFLWPPFHKTLLGVDLFEVIEESFSSINNIHKKRMIEYLRSEYPSLFEFKEKNESLTLVQNHALSFIPSKILSSLMNVSLNFGHKNYSYFLTRQFISFTRDLNAGIFKTYSKHNKYSSDEVKLPLALLSKKFDMKVYKQKMDSGLSFKDMSSSNYLNYLRKKRNSIERKIFNKVHSKKIELNDPTASNLDYISEIIDFDSKELNRYNKSSLDVLNKVISLEKSL